MNRQVKARGSAENFFPKQYGSMKSLAVKNPTTFPKKMNNILTNRALTAIIL